MDRNEFILAALAPSGGKTMTPVQVQKLFFLLDRNLSDKLGGPFFDFQPYDYGPFDSGVYQSLENLGLAGLVEVGTHPGRGWKTYRLSDVGRVNAEAAFNAVDKRWQEYMLKLFEFVTSLSFAELVSAIYKAYPEMKANSVFRE